MKITGPRSIFTSLFTTTIYFQLLLFFSTFLSLALILCKRQGRRNWQLLCTRWEQSYLFCAGPRQLLTTAKFLVPLTPSVSVLSPTGDKPWYLYWGKFATIYINLPLGVTNEESWPLCIRCWRRSWRSIGFGAPQISRASPFFMSLTSWADRFNNDSSL